MYSGWDNAAEACAEIDGVLASLRAGTITRGASFLFLPTGPLQEESLTSGWGDEFVDLANRFDAAMAAKVCGCPEEMPDRLIEDTALGMDERYGEVTLLNCGECGQVWLRYFYENEAFSRSGRWFMGPLNREQLEIVKAANALGILAGLDGYFYGGSYFDGKIGVASGTIQI